MSDTEGLPPPPPGSAPPGSEPPPPEPTAHEEAPLRRSSSVRLWLALGVLVAVLVVIAAALAGGDDQPDVASGSVSGSISATAPPSGSSAPVTIEGRSSQGHVPEGQPIPEWSAPALTGGTVAWSARPAGPTVLAIWAPWCPHCQAELPRLAAAVASHPEISLVTIATAVDPAAGPTPQEYMDDAGLSFPVGLDDPQGTLAVGLGVRGFPTTYFVDADGLVVASAEGELDPDAVDEVLTFLEGT